MFATAIIVFREVLEASLLVGIVAAATRSVPGRNRWLVAGIVAGLAGSGQIVSFGSRWQLKARVRNADAKPMNPDVYTVNTGVTRVRGNTEYAPIRALLDFRP